MSPAQWGCYIISGFSKSEWEKADSRPITKEGRTASHFP